MARQFCIRGIKGHELLQRLLISLILDRNLRHLLILLDYRESSLTWELVPGKQDAKELSKSILGSKKVVEFELGNYGSGGLLEPLQLSGINKTTSGLGFNCLFALKLIHPETYSFSYFLLIGTSPSCFLKGLFTYCLPLFCKVLSGATEQTLTCSGRSWDAKKLSSHAG